MVLMCVSDLFCRNVAAVDVVALAGAFGQLSVGAVAAGPVPMDVDPVVLTGAGVGPVAGASGGTMGPGAVLDEAMDLS